MKKILTGLAAGALALGVVAPASPASAGGSDTVYELLDNWSGVAALLIDAAGLDEALDDCGNTGNNNGLPNYTVFFPADDAILDAVLEALGLSLGQLLAQPALVKGALLNHVVKADIAPVQMADNSNTVFNTMGGLQLVKTTEFDGDLAINGREMLMAGGGEPYGQQACNGWVYYILGFLAPNTATPTDGLTTDGSGTSGSGEGLPKTGSESMALTYAALASLIAGAGVLVIRRRSVA